MTDFLTKLDALTILLEEKELETLTFFVKKAQECDTQHFAWQDRKQNTLTMLNCNVEIKRKDFYERESAIEALASLKFLSRRQVGGDIPIIDHITLFPAAFHRVRYQNKNWLRKQWALLWASKDSAILISLAALILSLISLALK